MQAQGEDGDVPTVDQPEDAYGDDVAEKSEQQGRLRDQAARQRDAAAALRDDRGARRDEAAGIRDQLARRRTDALELPAAGGTTAAEDMEVLLVVRAADSDRVYSHVDRVAAANDRTDAALDRHEALADRMAAARDRRQACLDGLTGAYNREAGMVELNRDLARAARTGQLVVVAFLDVDHLKAINDTHGHAAGDRALIAVADALTAALRPYDLVVRYGGDEFLCAVQDIDVQGARLRFGRVNEHLARTANGVAVTAGVALLRAGESTDEVIARADADLYQQRQLRHHDQP